MTTTPDVEFRTVPITAAGRGRRRDRELELITAHGWEIVDIQPRRFGSAHDHATLRRNRRPKLPTLDRTWWEKLWDALTEDLGKPAWERRLLRRLR